MPRPLPIFAVVIAILSATSAFTSVQFPIIGRCLCGARTKSAGQIHPSALKNSGYLKHCATLGICKADMKKNCGPYCSKTVKESNASWIPLHGWECIDERTQERYTPFEVVLGAIQLKDVPKETHSTTPEMQFVLNQLKGN